MKFLVVALFSLFTISGPSWSVDFEAAKKIAHEKNQLILLTFSGSDWCGPCIRLHKEVFDSEAFIALANDQLALVNADFPRLKKNQLPINLKRQNEKLADLYNAEGNFPSTVLLSAEGKVIGIWDGYPKQGATSFIEDLNSVIHANK